MWKEVVFFGLRSSITGIGRPFFLSELIIVVGGINLALGGVAPFLFAHCSVAWKKQQVAGRLSSGASQCKKLATFNQEKQMGIKKGGSHRVPKVQFFFNIVQKGGQTHVHKFMLQFAGVSAIFKQSYRKLHFWYTMASF